MNKVDSKRRAGERGEAYASKMLEKEGYTVICRNYCCRGGEIDISAVKGRYIVFAEVKTRRKDGCENAAEAVDETKMLRLKNAAEQFLNEYRDNEMIKSLVPRIDIIEVYTRGGAFCDYRHSTAEA